MYMADSVPAYVHQIKYWKRFEVLDGYPDLGYRHAF